MSASGQTQAVGAWHNPLVAEPACYIDGRWTAGEGETVAVVDPTRELPVASIALAAPHQAEAAVAAARRAFDGGAWSRLGPRDRSALLERVAELMEQRRAELVDVLVTEIGTPTSLAGGLQIDFTLENLRWFAEAARRGPRGGLEDHLPLGAGPPMNAGMVLREPIGVVAALTAYNFPLNIPMWKIGGALAAGCSTVVMSSARGVLSTLALVRLFDEAGFPPGAVNFVFGEPAVATTLVTSPDVDMVTLTGSAEVGTKVMAAAAGTIKKVVLELGGKSPDIVLPGVDAAAVAAGSVTVLALASGQSCGALTRAIVPRDACDAFVEGARKALAQFRVGDPRQADTMIGPLITAEHRRRVEGYVERAMAAGAEVAYGGGRPQGLPTGFFLEPTLLQGASPDSEIAQEELFGPVGIVLPYDTLDEAIALANRSRYGLNANVWGRTSEAIGVARRIRSGTVFINGVGPQRPDAPWGGQRQSGVGREGGEHGFLEFFDLKYVQWPVDGLQ